MPWNLIVKDTITAVFYESRTEKLWVGTPKSLYRFDGKAWKNYDNELGSHRITALESQGASIWIGTEDGLFVYRNGQFEQKGKVLPSQKINDLVWSEERKELYVAVDGAGIARLVPKKSVNDKDRWSLFTEEDGIMDHSPTALAVDSSGHVWAAHNGGLSHFTLRKWEQVQFADNKVNDISVDQRGGIWIATDKGVWRHLPDYATASGRKAELERGAAEEEGSTKSEDEWIHYHSGNGLSTNKVWAVLPQGGDVWFSTANGMEQFKDADYQITAFYEKLLPILNITDLYHLYAGMTIPLSDWGTLGFFVNFVSFGSTIASGDVDADDLVAYNSSEIVGGFSYGTRFPNDWGLGLSIKFFYSDLSSGAAAGEEEATTFGYAFDIGVLKKNLFIDKLNLALVLANIGPSVYYVDKTIEDPIPLTWRLGLSYEILSLADYKWTVVADYNREAKTAKEPTLSIDDFTEGNLIHIGSIRAAMKPKVLKKMRMKDTRFKRFLAGVKTQVDQGIPVIWGVTLGIFPEPGLPQSSGGHLRLIIGYNAKTKEILYSDSWGAGHELKRMPEDWAFAITHDAFYLKPL